MSPARAKRKVAILGGGLGALAAAFELTEQPNWRDKYDITLYQVGWRLGGKAASGRNPHPDKGQRIEEHGIHVFFGCYENAFFLLRRAYRALRRGRTTPLRDWRQAFFTRDSVVWGENVGQPVYGTWGVPFPRRPGWPGDLAARFRHPRRLPWQRVTPPTLRRQVLTWIDVGLRQMLDDRYAAPLWLRIWVLFTSLTLLLLDDVGARLLLQGHRWVARRMAEHLKGRIADPGARHLWLNLRTAEAVLVGMHEDGVFDGDADKRLDALDQEELTAWLKRHGAAEDILDSPFLRAGYDAAFAFAGGQRVAVDGELVRCVAAGAALRSMLRGYSYRHLPVWKMRSGMGDVVIMPLYQVLRERGVQFKFFHRVCQLEPSSDGQAVARIRLARQVRLKHSRAEYEPVVTVKGLPCWSSEPDFDQLVDGPDVKAAFDHSGQGFECPPWLSMFEGAPVVLERGTDFDDVVLGISLGGLEEIASPLAEVNPAWRRMFEQVTTTATLAAQWWLETPLRQLGWDTQTFESPIVTGLVEPVDTWADMSHLIEREGWAEGRVKSIAYFCGPLQGQGVDEHDPAQALASVYQRMTDFVEHDLRKIWPAITPARLYETLVAPPGLQGPARLWVQHYRANVSGSARYVLSRPGTTRARLPSERSGFSNLFLAGDWTHNGLNMGCAEAAVMSGMQAARGIACQDRQWQPITVWGEVDARG